jgi:prevent-host-death family protein
MKKVKVNEVRENLAKYLSEAEKGEEIIITRHAKPVARLIAVSAGDSGFPDLTDHRKSIKLRGKPISESITELRDEERY